MFSRRSLGLLILAAFLVTGAVPPEQEGLVRRLVQEDLFEWYQSQTDSALDPSYAGAYVMLAVGDELFIGLSASAPSRDRSGPLLAAHNGEMLRLIAPLDEQDVNRMRAVGDVLFIPGYDPNDGWDAGNLYRYDTKAGVFTKLRYRYDESHFVDATTTDANGKYLFSGLKPTSYIIKFILPEGYQLTLQQVDYNVLEDSNPSPQSGTYRMCVNTKFVPFQGVGSYEEFTIDAGVVPAEQTRAAEKPSLELQPDTSFYSGEMSIGDLVWIDSNINGLQDEGEPGLEGVRVELYTLDPYFPCVIHASGFWGDAKTGTLYYNGGVMYSNVTFVSDDFGDTWRVLTQDGDHYWARDFFFFNGYFYKTHHELRRTADQEVYIDKGILYSHDGIEWTQLRLPSSSEARYIENNTTWLIPEVAIDDSNALITFQGQLVVLETHGTALYVVMEGETHAIIPLDDVDMSGILPQFQESNSSPQLANEIIGASNRHNTLANANDELLYAIGGNNILYATPDLRQWYPVSDFNIVDGGAPLISLTFWDERQWLVVATAGEDGSIYYLPQGEVLATINNS